MSHLRPHRRIAFITLFLLFFSAGATDARPSLTGDFQHISGTTLTYPLELLPGVQRLTLNLDHRSNSGRLFARTDIRNRFQASADSIEWTLPEFWIELFFSDSDLRIGSQILQFGFSAANAPVDRILPLDFRNFLLEPVSTLERGTIALQYSYYTNNSRIRLIFSPVTTRSLIPQPDSRWFMHIPVPAGLPVQIESDKSRSLLTKQSQGALLWDSNRWRSVEFQAGILYWTPSMPAFKKDIRLAAHGTLSSDPSIILEETFTPTWILTGGISWLATSSLTALLEVARFGKKTFDRIPETLLFFDPAGPDHFNLPLVYRIIADEERGFTSRHPAWDILMETRYSKGRTLLTVQWYSQIIDDPHPDVIQDEWFQSVSVYARRQFFRERLKSDLTILYQINGQDFWIWTEHSYDIVDNVTLSAGTHFFGGPVPEMNYGHPGFGSYRNNNLVYAGIRYFF